MKIYFITYSIRLMILVFLVTINYLNLSSQQPSATFTSPTNNSSDVNLRPEFIIKTNLPIDSSSITWSYPNLDSTVWTNPVPPTMMILDKFVRDSIPDSLWKLLVIDGEYAMLNDTTLTFTPFFGIRPNSEYSAILSNLRVLRNYFPGGGYDTLNVDSEEISFKTVEAIHRLYYTSLDSKKFIKCNDTIEAKFSRELSSFTTPLGDLIELYSIDSLIVLGDTISDYALTIVPLILYLDTNDSSIVKAVPINNLIPGQNYLYKINGDYLTGDFYDYKQYNVKARDGYLFYLDAGMIGESSSTFDNDTKNSLLFPLFGYNGCLIEDTIIVTAKLKNDSLLFHNWEISDTTAIISQERGLLRISQDCANAKDLYIKANYTRYETTYAFISDNDSLTVSVYDDSLNYLGGSGTYTMDYGDKLYVTATSNTYSSFKKWYSSSSYYNDYDKPFIGLSFIGTNFDFYPLRDTDPDPPEKVYCVCAYATTDHGCYDENGEIATVTPDPCQNTGNQSTDVNVTCTINPQYLGLYEISWIFDDHGSLDELIPPVSSCSTTVKSTSPCRRIIFFLQPKEALFDLTVEVLLDKATDLSPYGGTGEIGEEKDVTVLIEIINCDLLDDKGNQWFTFDYVEENPNPIVIPVPALSIVRLTAINYLREEGFEFVRWWDDTDGPYTFPTPTTQEQFEFLMTSDKNVKAEFIEHFRLREVGFYKNDDRSTVNWYPTKLLRNNIADDLEVYRFASGLDQGYETRIKFKFNDDVNQSSINAGIKSYDLSERVDRPYNNYTNRPLVPSSSYWAINQLNYGFDNNRQVWFDVKEPASGNAVPKGEEFQTQIGWSGLLGILNTRDKIMVNPLTFRSETELPGVINQLTRLRLLSTSGDGGVEWMILTKSQLCTMNSQSDISCTIFDKYLPWGDYSHGYLLPNHDHDLTQYYDSEIFNVADLNRNQLIQTAIQVLDFDGSDGSETLPIWDDWMDYIPEMSLIVLLDYLYDYNPTPIPDASPLGPGSSPTSIFYYLGLALEIVSIAIGIFIGLWLVYAILVSIYNAIASTIASENEADAIGNKSFNYTWNNKWFGAHPSIKPTTIHPNGSFWHWNHKISDMRGNIKLRKTNIDNSTY